MCVFGPTRVFLCGFGAFYYYQTMIRTKVKIGAWNVHGLSGKLKDEDVRDYIEGLDFVALVETWSTVRTNVHYKGYGTMHQIRHKHKRKGRPSGGIVLMYKSKLKGQIQRIPCKHEDILIAKINGPAVGHVRDIFLIVVYVKPGVETSTGSSVFDTIMEQLADLAPKGDTLLMEDFNARTSELEDFDVQSENPAFTTLNTCHDSNDNQLPHRHNCDKIVNKNGQLLIDLCRSTEHRIINGRFVGDYGVLHVFKSEREKLCRLFYCQSGTFSIC